MIKIEYIVEYMLYAYYLYCEFKCWSVYMYVYYEFYLNLLKDLFIVEIFFLFFVSWN